jgi:hypothetical protein
MAPLPEWPAGWSFLRVDAPPQNTFRAFRAYAGASNDAISPVPLGETRRLRHRVRLAYASGLSSKSILQPDEQK